MQFASLGEQHCSLDWLRGLRSESAVREDDRPREAAPTPAHPQTAPTSEPAADDESDVDVATQHEEVCIKVNTKLIVFCCKYDESDVDVATQHEEVCIKVDTKLIVFCCKYE